MTKREKIQVVLDLIRNERRRAVENRIRNAAELASWKTTDKMLEEERKRDENFSPFGIPHSRQQANRFKEIEAKSVIEYDKWAEIETFITDEFLNEKENQNS